MFVDASALAAMLTDETKARLLAGRLQAAPNRFTAPPCLLDATAVVAGTTGLALPDVFPLVDRFAQAMGIKSVSLPATLAPMAAEAMHRFALTPNQGLAYAAARYYRVPLVFDDPAFASTDIQPG